MSKPTNPYPYFPGHRFLHSPGPTHIPKAVRDAMTNQPMDLADPRVDPMIAGCEDGLRRLLGTQSAEIFLYAANGHGGWEAVIANLLAPGKKVLIAGTGHFSDSWALMAEAMGAVVVRTPYREGYPIDPAEIEQVLRADTGHEIVALFAVHTDTASSTTNDIPALRAALDAAGHPALFVVDVVASLGATQVAMDAWGINVIMGASQKGLMTPPGVAFCAVDARAMDVSAKNPAHRFYWDWRLRANPFSYKKFCGTPPHNLLMGLHAALGLIFEEGVEQVLARHRKLAGAVQAAVEGWAQGGKLGFLVQVPQARSVSVTTILLAPDVSSDEIRTVAREEFQVSIAGGLGPFQGRVIRIGHLGDLNPAMILGCLGGVDAALRKLRIPIGDDAMQRAVRALSD